MSGNTNSDKISLDWMLSIPKRKRKSPAHRKLKLGENSFKLALSTDAVFSKISSFLSWKKVALYESYSYHQQSGAI